MNLSQHNNQNFLSISGASSMGVTADMKAALANNIVCETIITTSGNTTNSKSNAVSFELLKSQWDSFSRGHGAKLIKIGELANIEQVKWLVKTLTIYRKRFPLVTIVYQTTADLVNPATHQMLGRYIQAHLLPLVDTLFFVLDNEIKHRVSSLQKVKNLGNILRKNNQINVVVTLLVEDQQYDCIFGCDATKNQDVVHVLSNKNGGSVVSTVSTFSSIFCCLMLNEYRFSDALMLARGTMNQAIFKENPLGNGRDQLHQLGPVQAFQDLPYLTTFDQLLAQPLMNSPVVASFSSCGRTLGLFPRVDSIELLKTLLLSGVSSIQYRPLGQEKIMIEQEVMKAISLGQQYKSDIYIVDEWALSIKHKAYGVHLDNKLLQDNQLEQIRDAGLRLGVNARGVTDILKALAFKPSYIALGPAFPNSHTHLINDGELSDKLLLELKLFKHRCPVIAFGGISVDNVDQLKKMNVDGFGVTSALKRSSDIASTINLLNSTC